VPRRLRFCPAGFTQHVIQRGNNKQAIFNQNRDIAAYARWLQEAASKYGVEIHAWVFMTNHVHLLVTPTSDDAISKSIQYLGRLYVEYFNRTYNRTGTLYEGRFKSHFVQDGAHSLNCQHYIEMNPVRAGMVKDPADYIWSSFRSAAFGNRARLWTPNPEYLNLDGSALKRRQVYRSRMASWADQEFLDEIRHAATKGLTLGTEKFRKQVEQLRNRSRQSQRRELDASEDI